MKGVYWAVMSRLVALSVVLASFLLPPSTLEAAMTGSGADASNAVTEERQQAWRTQALRFKQQLLQDKKNKTSEASREARNRPLPLDVKKPLFFKLFAQLTEGQFQRPDPARFEPSDIELVASSAFEDLDRSGGDDLHSVLRIELDFPRVASPHHARQLRGSVLESEVEVTAAVLFEVADLSDDVQRRGQR